MILHCTKQWHRYIMHFLLPAFLLPAQPSYAQYNAAQNSVWIFGNNAGLRFNTGSPVAISSAMNTGNVGGTMEANTSVSDSTGALLFYTDGSVIRDRSGNVMPNGNDLTGQGNGSTNSTSQGALIVPMPDSAQKYYVFSLTAIDQAIAVRGRLYYSVIDMTLHAGMGDVIPGRKGIFIETGLTEKMIGIRGNRCNMWVLTCVRGQAAYKAYEITAGGFNAIPVISNTGTPKNLSFGYLAVSPDRKHIACSEQALFGGNNGLELARFDAATGIVSGAVQLEPELGYYGVCFSPDNTRLYGSSFADVFQFDITAPDPVLTKTLISGNGRNSGITLGPDGRVYFQHSGTGNSSISFIKYPNLAGMACSPQTDVLSLLPGTSMNFGFHNEVPVFGRDTVYSGQEHVAGCFAADYTLTATDTAGWDYQWNGGSQQTRITVAAGGTYYVQYHTEPCVFHTDTFSVSFPNGVLPRIGIRNSCKGLDNGKAWAYTFSGDTVQYHYTWINAAQDTLAVTDSLLPAPSGYYTLSVSTAHCDTTLSVYIPEENDQVSFSADTLICLGEPLSYQNTSALSFTQYKWYFGDNDSSVAVSPVHTFPQPGVYRTLLAGTGPVCADTASMLITVDAPVTDMFFGKEPAYSCTGQQVQFSIGTDSTLSGLFWEWGDGSSLSAREGDMTHAYDHAGTMPVAITATFRACPAVQVHDTVKVYALPLVDLGPDSVLCLGGSMLSLSNKAPVAPGSTYLWNTGSSATAIPVRHDGAYSLTVTNEHGCSTTESVLVRKDCYIDIPNAFTPDGDGVNDYFFPRQLAASGLTAFHMKVISRWGQVVFETSRINGRGWDGTFNGKAQPEGVYLYFVEAAFSNGRTEQYQGNVTLLR